MYSNLEVVIEEINNIKHVYIVFVFYVREKNV